MFNNPYYNAYNPYMQYGQQQQTYNNLLQQPQQANTLPPQQVVQVNGKASVDTIQLAPNSSILVMDTSAPIVWLCTSDGVGKVTAKAYDIIEHKDTPPIDTANLEQRITAVENFINKLMEGANNESNVSNVKSKQNGSKSATN